MKNVEKRKFQRLTKASAQALIKREFGISAMSLSAPPDMNQNPKHPFYRLESGNMCIEVSTESDGAMITLLVRFNNECSLRRFFYADTPELEEAFEYAEAEDWKGIWEKLGYPRELDDIVNRKSYMARKACQARFSR